MRPFSNPNESQRPFRKGEMDREALFAYAYPRILQRSVAYKYILDCLPKSNEYILFSSTYYLT